MSTDVCAEADRSARLVSKPLLREKTVSWDIPGGCMGTRANERRERGTATGSDSLSEGTLVHIQPRECILRQGTVPRCCS